jgi:hypothetical protein
MEDQKLVGIIIPTKARFDLWVKTFGVWDEKYFFINSIEGLAGCEFHKVLISDDAHFLDGFEDISNHSKSRIRLKGE